MSFYFMLSLFADELDNPGPYRSLMIPGEDPSLHVDGPPSPIQNDKLLQKVLSQLPSTLEAESTIASPSDHSSVSSPGLQSPGSIHTPRETDVILQDTQMSLIENCARVHLDETFEGQDVWGGLKSLSDGTHNDDGAARIFQNVADQSAPTEQLENGIFLEEIVGSSSSPPASNAFGASTNFTFKKFGKLDASPSDQLPSSTTDSPQLLEG
jgi:hypothetical protein